ncbi:MAG: hypothetical protein ACSHYF_16310 [Verrucomicrobiaceae bacterium]
MMEAGGIGLNEMVVILLLLVGSANPLTLLKLVFGMGWMFAFRM